MLLKRAGRIGEFRAVDMRSAMRDICCMQPANEAFEERFGERAAAALDEGLRQGFLLTKREGDAIEITRAGVELANARIGSPVPRDVANQRLDEVLSRVMELNEDSEVPRAVVEVAVFGEYLDPERSEIDRLDIMLRTAERPGVPPFDPYGVAGALARAKGLPPPSGMMAALFFVDNYIFRRVRARRTEIGLVAPYYTDKMEFRLRFVLRRSEALLEPWSLARRLRPASIPG